MTDTPYTDHKIDTPQGRLFARHWQGSLDRPAILLLHDSLGSVELWRDFPERLSAATERSVIAYDRLGFGQSDAHPGSLGLGFIHDEARTGLAAVIQAFGLGRMVLAGHSVGGGMALAGAAAWPDQTDAVVTIAAQAFVEDRTLAGVEQARALFADPEQVGRVARYHGDKAPWVLEAWIGTWLRPDFADWSLDDDLARVRAPVLAIHGDEDEYGSPAHPRRIRDLSGGPVDLEVMTGCRHMPHRERPDEVLARISRFLRDR